jgi:hypothetical protein
MSIHPVPLDEEHFRVAEEKARAIGKTAQEYLQALIDADSRSFDEILEPARRGFDSMSDSELDDLLGRARRAARQKTENDSK